MEEDFAALHRIDTAPPPVIAASKGTPAAAAPRTLATSASLTKLEPFILLAKSTKGAGAAALVDRVISASGVYTFTEFLQLKSIQEVSVGGCRGYTFINHGGVGTVWAVARPMSTTQSLTWTSS